MIAKPVIFSLSLLLVADAALAADYYVAPHGNDGHPGTRDQPWASLAKVNEVLQPGDTAHLRGGVYVKQQIKPSRSGTKEQPIRYAAYNREQPVLTEIELAIDLTDRSFIVIDAINVDGGGIFEDASVGSWLWLSNSHGNVVQNCHFQYARGWSGVRIDGGSRFNRILNNRIDCTGSYDRTGISVGGQRTIPGRIPPEQGGGDDSGDLFDMREASSNLIEGNHLSRGGHGLLVCLGERNVIRNNLFENRWGESEDPDHIYGRGAKGNRTGALSGRGQQQGGRNLYEGNFVIYSYPASDQPLMTAALKVESLAQICRRNVFYHNHSFGISTTARGGVPQTKGNKIFHNTFYNNGGPAWRVDQFASGGRVELSVFKNNIVFRNRQSPPIPEHDVDLFLGVLRGDEIVANTFVKAAPGDGRFWVEDHGSQPVGWYEERFPENFRRNLEAAPRFVADEPQAFAEFALKRGAPQIDAGAFLTRSREAGRGAVLPVVDAGYFCDGFEIVPGDLIQLEGSRRPVRIARVDYERNELHLERPLRWKAGQGVALPFRGRAPDMGAFEFGR